jgi:hypothetical protein
MFLPGAAVASCASQDMSEERGLSSFIRSTVKNRVYVGILKEVLLNHTEDRLLLLFCIRQRWSLMSVTKIKNPFLLVS